MKQVLFISIISLLYSCSPTSPDLSGLINESRIQLENLAIVTGYTMRGKEIIAEYDKLSNLIDKGLEVVTLIRNSKYLNDSQKVEFEQAIQNGANQDVLKLALLGFYKPNLIGFNFPLDACEVKFSKDGVVRVGFYSSGLSNHIKFATNKEDYKQGNLITQNFDYGTTEYKLKGLTNGDSVFGYFTFPYFNFDEPRFEFRGKYEGESR